MAIIKCPNCNEDVSNKSTECVHCGKKLVEEAKIFCEDCGKEISKNESKCLNCGCPVEKNEVPQKVEVTKVQIGFEISKKKIIAILIVIVVFIIATIVGINIYRQNEAKKEEQRVHELNREYKSNLKKINYKMLVGAADAEACGNKIKSVWYNTIWEESDYETDKYTKKNGRFNDDFNDSINTLFSDPDFIEIIDSVEKNQIEVKTMMKDMKNPPEDWEDAYDDLKEYYEDYITLTNLCINPSGNLTTYSNNFNQADLDTVNGYEKISSYLED